ncbi:MAG: Hint domain-containing protein, partial [Acetobacteraceae bacterium]|nr:Hint domain-containing protein [Acetobacteraceae bacterium]
SIAWQVTGSGPDAADAADFLGGILPTGRVTFVAGEASRTITVRVAGDTKAEPDEGFTVSLGETYAGLGVAGPSAGATIADDDTLHCFAPGTRIATPFGARSVETLQPGDAVLTHDGMARVLCWTGAWTTDPADPAHRPVRIRANAFGPGRPARDLLVSPSHGLWLEGAMVPAIALLDGVRVLRDAAAPGRFHHVALPFHAAILAEGLAAETFCLCGDDRYTHLPAVADPLPRLDGGVALEELRDRLGLAPRPHAGPRDGFLERVLQRPDGIWVEGWASEADGPARLTIAAGGAEMRTMANLWRIDLDRAGLPAAGFSAWVPGVHGADVRVLRASDGTALPLLV